MRAALLLLVLTCTACGSMRNGDRWGQGATLAPGGDRLLVAARDAAFDPWTWGPLAGAGVLSISDWDEDLSRWARSETPIFGSTKHALDASDDLRDWTEDAWIVSMIATPSGTEPMVWAQNKFQGLFMQWSATWITSESTSLLKEAFERERPDGSNQRSMPSGHASSAFASRALASDNIGTMQISNGLRWTLDAGLFALAGGTAWARVEAGKHYPTDVLAGAALGNFIARFVDEAFLDLHGGIRLMAYADAAEGEWALGLEWSF